MATYPRTIDAAAVTPVQRWQSGISSASDSQPRACAGRAAHRGDSATSASRRRPSDPGETGVFMRAVSTAADLHQGDRRTPIKNAPRESP